MGELVVKKPLLLFLEGGAFGEIDSVVQFCVHLSAQEVRVEEHLDSVTGSSKPATKQPDVTKYLSSCAGTRRLRSTLMMIGANCPWRNLRGVVV